ncbi:MAG TPA: C25 family cysteine peptidase [Candidatus Cloacimonadota bacterium]|nr:C25 family cysteine peptidase [Candidatus Cloacimonadota bacterium]
MNKVAWLFLLCMLISGFLFAETVSMGNGSNSVSIISSSETETILQYQISNFVKNKVALNDETWYQVSLPHEGITLDKGFPELPVFNRSICISGTAKMNLEVYDVLYRDFQLPIVPSKGNLTRNINPETVPYVFGEIYQQNEFYPAQIAQLSEPYILREVRGITIRTNPMAYNPVTKTLRVYTAYKIRVFADGLDYRNLLTKPISRITNDFVPIYQNHFLNWQNSRYTSVSDTFGKLLVICPSTYLTQIAPYVNWKTQKGIPTELIDFATIGTTAAQLKTYIQNRYNADTSIAFIQIVGDDSDVPAYDYGTDESDPSYSLVAGNDEYPDIFIGRFSANSTTDVTTQVNKTIAFERDVTTSATWLQKAFGIGSSSGTGDDGEYDYQHIANIKTDLVNYGYTTVDEIYYDSSTAAQVTTAVNGGRGFGNYCGHGSTTSWGTTGFSNTNVNALTNGSMTPFIVSVACVNGDFAETTCFAEAWLRKSGGGAVAFYGSSVNQSWNPPMIAQDEITDLLVAEQKTTIGGLFYNGACRMLDESSDYQMFRTWHIFGDASLVARTKTPIAMTVTHPSSISAGTTSINVSAGVANALVSITYNNTIYGRAFTNSSGNATVTLTNPPSGTVTYTITVTAFNRVTYTSSINQIPASGPWLNVTAANYDDDNNDVPEYNEAGYLDVTFLNSGTVTATNVSAILTCTTSGITITDNSATITSLAANASTTLDNAFAFTIANNIANGTAANFTITMTMSGYDPWTYNFSKTIYAPVLAFGTMTISDPAPGNNNGNLDPGETVTVTMPLTNTGGAASLSGSATLTSPTSGITINSSTANFSAITASGSINLSFSVSAASGMSVGSIASLVFNAAAGAYSANTSVSVEVGAPTVITIGTGTSSQTYPLDRYYNYSTHEAIYLASEIGTAATIKSLAFYKASGTDVTDIQPVTIYMKNTTSATLATGTYSTTGYTQVYSGTFPNNATSGWMEINLSPQFVYDGVSNLSILTVKGYQAWIYAYPYWTYTTTATYRARQERSDSAQPTSLTASYNLPNLRLKVFPTAGVLYPPQNLAASATHASVILTWSAPVSGSPTGYKIYRNSSLLTTVTGFTYTDTAVTDGTTYSYYLTAVYQSGESSPTSTVTAIPNMYAPANLTAVGGNTIVNLSWTAASGREDEQDVSSAKELPDRIISGYKIYRNSVAVTTVTGTSYQDTGLTNGVTYSYYVTTVYTNPAGESAASNTATATPNIVTSVIIGTGTSSTGTYDACPISVWYQSLHGQAVYTAAELNAAGISGQTVITQLGFYVTGLPDKTMPNYVVRMKHTTAANAASWQTAANMVTVWSSSSYQPTATGWNMFTLTTPFTWNGTDNIVIDTAFGLIGSYSSTGTVQYTSVTNGYHYIRYDSADMTNIFTDNSAYYYGTTAYRPNLKLTVQPQQTGPYITVNPTSISATIYAGNSAAPVITIQNTGTSALNWSTEANFAPWGTANPASGTVAASGNSSLTLNLNSAGLAVGTYTDEVVITSNATNNPSLTIPVSLTVQAIPNPSAIRFVAEWEPATGVIIAYANGFGLPYTMIADLSTRGKVYVVVTSSNQSTANSLLSSNGVTMSNVYYINPSGVNTYWTRDYGPWTVFDENGNMKIVDFRYNRNRPYDDSLNEMLDDYFGVGFSYLPLVATGGNVMTDGAGKMMSTNLILSENDGVQTAQVTEYSYTQAQIEDLVYNNLGVTEYQFYNDPLSNSSIDHIDCWAKLLDVDKVMIARVPSGHANYAALEAAVTAWQTKTSAYGTPYQIFRVDQSSNNEPYTNSFIYNHVIYVPQWNSTPSSYDTAAITAYQNAMPGYTIKPYYLSSWLPDDAIHCRINTIFDDQMIHVSHIPPTTLVANSTVTLNVEIKHTNALVPDSIYVAYRYSSTGSWQTAPLTNLARDEWSAVVPTPAYGQTLYYYISATDNTGRSMQTPLCGVSDPFELLVNQQPPNSAPTIVLPESFSFDMNGSLVIDFSSYVNDADGDNLTLSYSGSNHVSVSVNGLTVTLTAAQDWFGSEELTFTVTDGLANASSTVTVNVHLNYLAEPIAGIVQVSGNTIKVSWNAVPNAQSYDVWSCSEPYGTYIFLGKTANLYWEDTNGTEQRKFYKVIATDENPYPVKK